MPVAHCADLTADARREAEVLLDLIRLGWGKNNPAFRQVFTSLFLPDGTPEQHQWFNDLERLSALTSFAFILGLLPLVVASAASQLARRDVGTPVFGGMIAASLAGIFAIQPLYVTFQWLREKIKTSASVGSEQK